VEINQIRANLKLQYDQISKQEGDAPWRTALSALENQRG
jgi:hypothetical protein